MRNGCAACAGAAVRRLVSAMNDVVRIAIIAIVAVAAAKMILPKVPVLNGVAAYL